LKAVISKQALNALTCTTCVCWFCFNLAGSITYQYNHSTSHIGVWLIGTRRSSERLITFCHNGPVSTSTFPLKFAKECKNLNVQRILACRFLKDLFQEFKK